MSVPPEHHSRFPEDVRFDLLESRLVVIVGVGTVGSRIAEELANSNVGRLRLIDGKSLKKENVRRHILHQESVDKNKAEETALLLDREIEALRAEALGRNVDMSMSDDDLDQLLKDADLIVISTDAREAQRRVAQRALALDIPAVLPGLYERGGGEVFVQLNPGRPCFFCWDAFRDADDQLRGVAAFGADTLALIQIAFELSIGILDSDSEFSRRLAPSRTNPQPQLFVLEVRDFLAEGALPVQRRLDCPACRVGPANPDQATELTAVRQSGSAQADSTAPDATLENLAVSSVSLVCSVLTWIFFEGLFSGSKDGAVIVPLVLLNSAWALGSAAAVLWVVTSIGSGEPQPSLLRVCSEWIVRNWSS